MPVVRPATEADIAELVRLRELLFTDLGGEWGTPPAGEGWRDRCAAELARQLRGDALRILVIDGDEGLAACGMGVIDQRLPSPYNPGGKVGHVFGVVTDPAYRGRGHARAVMEGLLAWFHDSGARRVDLNASPDGMPLYRKLGFADHPDPTLSLRARAEWALDQRAASWRVPRKAEEGVGPGLAVDRRQRREVPPGRREPGSPFRASS
jgi:ribosomal protein S18 acetylase RimI-like enzyme